MMRRREMMQAENILPSAYYAVEYLESSGTQYIDSGIECTSDLIVDFGFSALTDVNLALCGGIDLRGNPTYFRHHCSPHTNFGYSNLYWMQYNSGGVEIKCASFTFDVKHTLTVNPVTGRAVLDGATLAFTSLASGYTTGKSYGIFARIDNTGALQSRPSKIYYFKFYRNGALIGDFLPCVRRSDSKPGMYDTVTKAFFVNAGSGEFTAGPNV